MLKNDSIYKNYTDQIKSANKIAIIIHKNSDMDAIGSAIALKRLLKLNCNPENQDLQIDIFSDTENIESDDYNLNKYAIFTKNEVFNKRKCKEYDLAICLDTANKKLLGKYERIMKYAKDTLNLDHHQTNTIYANNNIVVPKFSSTCELIYTLFIKVNGYKYTDTILRYLYAGIITDTDNLTNNIGRNTFKVIDGICGKDTKKIEQLEKIRNYFFKNESRSKFSLLKKAFDSIKFSEDGKIALMKLTKQDFHDSKACMSDTIGIIDYATKLEGVEIACIFIKQENNTYYVSLRSKNDVNVGEIAEKMGGGGHAKAAAFQTKPTDNLKDVKSKLISLCQAELKTEQEPEDLSNLFEDQPVL